MDYKTLCHHDREYHCQRPKVRLKNLYTRSVKNAQTQLHNVEENWYVGSLLTIRYSLFKNYLYIKYSVFPRKITLNKYLHWGNMTISGDTFHWHITELERMEKYCEDTGLAIPEEGFIDSAQESQKSST